MSAKVSVFSQQGNEYATGPCGEWRPDLQNCVPCWLFNLTIVIWNWKKVKQATRMKEHIGKSHWFDILLFVVTSWRYPVKLSRKLPWEMMRTALQWLLLNPTAFRGHKISAPDWTRPPNCIRSFWFVRRLRFYWAASWIDQKRQQSQQNEWENECERDV